MATDKQSKSPSTRRYSPAEREQAVRLVRQLRKELGTDQGTVGRVARQLGYGVESVRSWVKCRILHKTQYGEPGIMRNALVRVG